MLDDQPRTPYFPPDLAAIVVEYLGDDVSALLACSLVSRAWTPPSRRHLFKELFLEFRGRRTRERAPDRGSAGIMRFDGLWDEAEWASEERTDEQMPPGAARVQNVDVHDNKIKGACNTSGNPEGRQDDRNRQDGASYYTSEPRPLYAPIRWRYKSEHSQRAPASADLFSSPYCTLKPHIRLLRLRFIDDDADERTSEDTSAAILRTFAALPMLRELEIHSTRLSAVDTDAMATSFPQIIGLVLRGSHVATDLWALVARFPALVTLDISFTAWPHTEDLPPPPPRPIALHTLVGAARELVRLPVGHLTARALSVLAMSTQDLFAVAALLPHLGVLTALAFEFADSSDGELPQLFLDAVDLTLHPALSALSFACSDPSLAPVLVEALPWYLAAAPARLARFTLDITLSGRYVTYYAWAPADAAFARHAGLCGVALALRVEEDTTPRELERIAAVVRACLPAAHRRGILHVSASR